MTGSVSQSASPSIAAPRLIRRLRQSPHLSDEQIRLFFHRFQLDLEVGLGLPHGRVNRYGLLETVGVEPDLMLQWSDDGGHTWSDEHWMTAGRLGQYRFRVIWRRLGKGRNRTWRLTMSDPVAWRLLDAYVEVEKGTF